MATCSVRYEPHLSDKARSSEASRFSITKYGMLIYKQSLLLMLIFKLSCLGKVSYSSICTLGVLSDRVL